MTGNCGWHKAGAAVYAIFHLAEGAGAIPITARQLLLNLTRVGFSFLGEKPGSTAVR